jgi:hypothetical protein
VEEEAVVVKTLVLEALVEEAQEDMIQVPKQVLLVHLVKVMLVVMAAVQV